MLTGKDLIELGLKPGKQFADILEKSKTFASREEAMDFARGFLPPETQKAPKKPSVAEGSVLHWFLNNLRSLVPPFLEGTKAEPSSSEIRRLFENRAVLINGCAPGPDACMDNQFPIWQLVFFPNGKRKTTLVSDPKPADACEWFDCDGNMLTGTDEQKKEWIEFLASLDPKEEP